jgi:hypothetical protein
MTGFPALYRYQKPMPMPLYCHAANGGTLLYQGQRLAREYFSFSRVT